MTKGQKDVAAGSVLAAFSIAYFALSFQIKLMRIDRVVGSRMFPQILGVCMFLLGVFLIVNGVIAWKREKAAAPAEGAKSEADPEAAQKRRQAVYKTLGVFVGYAFYIFLMDKIGFTVSSILYLFSQMLLMAKRPISKKQYLIYAATAVITAVVLYYMFVVGFQLILPKASWF